MKKMYIAVLDEVPDFMVPTLVAHTVLNAHIHMQDDADYADWLENSFKKVVLRVNRKEFEKIRTMDCWLGHENTTLEGEKSCVIPVPMEDAQRPNVLKFARLWEPKQNE